MLKNPRFYLSCFIFMITLWLYTSTAVPGLVVGGEVESESAQLQRVSYRLGIAHSTGYPIYTMMGYSMAQLGKALDQNPYTWVTYLSCVCAAVGAVLFFQLALELSNAPSAFAATALLMVTNIVWHLATIPETQALHLISIVGMLWLTVKHIQQPNQFWIMGGLALLAGIGLANHRTSVLMYPTAGLAVLLTGALWKLKWKQWIILILLFVIPVTSYGYLFLRVREPNIVFSTRPTWFPSGIYYDEVVDLIRGTIQDGRGLEGNMRLPEDDSGERLAYIRENLRHELSYGMIILGLLGLLIITISNWRISLIFIAHIVIWSVFLMSWRLGKGVIYHYALTIPLILGMGVLFSGGLNMFSRRDAALPRPFWAGLRPAPTFMALLSLPIFAFAINIYKENRPIRDLSNDHEGQQYYEAFTKLPPNSLVYTGGWTPESFILLEYIDDSGREDVMPIDNRWEGSIQEEFARSPGVNIFLAPFMRGWYGFYGGAVWLQYEYAFSGTYNDVLIQVRPKMDEKLQIEADQAIVIQHPMTEGIQLYSYIFVPEKDGLRITLYWECTAPVTTHYSIFNHLRRYDSDGNLMGLVAQDDSYAPVEGTYPTTIWTENEIIKDTYFIPASPDGLTLVIGMTNSQTGEVVGEFHVP